MLVSAHPRETSTASLPRGARLKAFFRALRPHQWAKNGLVGMPLLAAHHLNQPGRCSRALPL